MRAASLPSRPRKVIRWPPAKVITREPTWTATSRFSLTVAPTFRSKEFSESDGELVASGEVDDPTPTSSTIAGAECSDRRFTRSVRGCVGRLTLNSDRLRRHGRRCPYQRDDHADAAIARKTDSAIPTALRCAAASLSRSC